MDGAGVLEIADRSPSGVDIMGKRIWRSLEWSPNGPASLCGSSRMKMVAMTSVVA